ncbi:hypothetical protein [[Enterobacter] lignolyticus]|uniref:Uncharacterized protein n=1 Tax=Enterobacter lignolyticus (strain SCF1) TaxID=701347 RepID=E3G683_ENTLS|nr:hypothetical protein [[Enterobacter] lignolyticus]ADO49542.1 hypothetical protein Entcl_3297 [[Enterobacter] lignolyticus SCF1]
MNKENSSQVYNSASYSEITAGNLDFIDLAERCELLSQIIIDAHESESITPVLRCLSSYLSKLNLSLEEDMSRHRIMELTINDEFHRTEKWIFADSDLQCEYCQALTSILMRNTCNSEEREVLSGLLHDLIGYMTYELKEPRFGVIDH